MTDDDDHFASDEELLSGYALGRLDDDGRKRVENHAAVCAACREALRSEMRIAAGARRLGREALRAGLKKRLAAPPARARWPLVVSAAAALVIASGLGVYYAWFSGPGGVSPGGGAGSPIAGRVEAPLRSEINVPDRGAADKTAPLKTEAAPPPLEGRPSAALKTAPASGSRSAEHRRAPESAAQETGLSGGLAGRGRGDQQGEFWSEGVLEEAPGNATPATAVEAAPADGDRLFRLKKEVKGKDEARFGEEAVRVQGITPGGAGQQYLIRQQPASDLPKNRRSPGNERNSVPTRVDQRGDTTTMTLYLDSLVDERDLKSARVDALRDDSVVVAIGGKKILYRFPPGQSLQQRQK